jgi:membrane protease YdiL (CAAX protease family)
VLVALLVVGMGLVVASFEARRPLGPGDGMRRLLERIPATHPAWMTALTAASVGEEFAYRGVLTELCTGPFGAGWAVVASAGLFGLGHLAQGWRGAVASAAFAMALQVIVFISGGLALAMLAHFAYDIGAMWLGRRIQPRQIQDKNARCTNQ